MALVCLLLGLGFGCLLGFFHAERRRFERQLRFLNRIKYDRGNETHDWEMGRLAGLSQALDAYVEELQ